MAASTNKIIYIDAPTGIAGDMLLAALLDAGGDSGQMLAGLRRLPLGEWSLEISTVYQQDLAACDVAISYPPQHQHRHLADIEAMITAAHFPPRAEALALRAFRLLAEAEAHAHGCGVQEVHFHEVGAVDSLLDICGVALLIDQLDIRQAYCSPLPLTGGYVDCEHGRLPVPAPATAYLLRGLSLTASDIKGEAITPTGAALLQALEAKSQPCPELQLLAVGRGAGKRKLAGFNMVRVLLGEAEDKAAEGLESDEVDVIVANMDDCSGEMLAALWDKAFALGALDMCYGPLLMKKGRPAWQLQLIVPAGQAADFAALVLAETTTLGCRVDRQSRYKLARTSVSVDTAYGPIAVIRAGNTLSPEADSVSVAAAAHNTTFKQVYAAALAAAVEMEGKP